MDKLFIVTFNEPDDFDFYLWWLLRINVRNIAAGLKKTFNNIKISPTECLIY